MNELSNDLEVITKEINEYAKQLGEVAWKVGKLVLGQNATAKQIANYLASTGFGGPFKFTPDLILNFMMRVNPDELS